LVVAENLQSFQWLEFGSWTALFICHSAGNSAILTVPALRSGRFPGIFASKHGIARRQGVLVMKIGNGFLALLGTTFLSVSAPVFAADVAVEPELSPFSAEIDGWAGGLFITDETENVEPDETDLFVYGADARLRLDVSDAISIQLDGSIDGTDKNSGNDYHQGGWLAGGHLSWSNSSSGLLGVFGGVGTGESDDDDTDFWLVGGEGQMYLDAATLYLQVGYFDAEADGTEEDAFHNAIFGRLVGRYFLSPETRLQAEFSYANGDQDTDDQNMDVLGWGARMDHQLFDSVGLFAAYDGGYYDNGNGSDTGSYFEHQVRGGVSISLGRPDLLTSDRSGPNLDMPWLTHWASSGNSVD
jgi:hypothetical protein